MQDDLPRPLRKGLLWQQKDKFFSRWKERFFVLTDDYLQCFKKENSRISEMGSFLARVLVTSLVTSSDLEWPLCVSVQAGRGGGGGAADQEGLPHHRPQPRQGRPGPAQEARGHPGLVQPDQGVSWDWDYCHWLFIIVIQAKVLECKARQVQHDIASNNLNVEAWLLARKSLAGSNGIHKLNHW